MSTHQRTAGLIWSVADKLRGVYKQSEYGKVILPLTVLRRLDCVMAPTRAAVWKRDESTNVANKDQILKNVAKMPFYNEEMPLSEVIAELNDRFGLDLGTSDRVIIGQQIASLVEDPQLQAVAAVEGIERFGQVADPKLDRMVGELHDANDRFVGRYFDNPEFQAAVKEIALRRAYDIILSPARDEALRRLKESGSSGSLAQ